MSAPGKDLVFALLMLYVKRLDVRMKSTWLCTCPLGACQVAGVQSVGKGESLALCKLKESSSSVVCLSNAKSSFCPCLVLIRVMAHFGIPIALNYKYILLGSLSYDIIKLLVDMFELIVFHKKNCDQIF